MVFDLKKKDLIADGYMEKIPSDLCFKSMYVSKNNEDKVTIGEFDVCSGKTHGRVVTITNDFFQFEHYSQGDL